MILGFFTLKNKGIIVRKSIIKIWLYYSCFSTSKVSQDNDSYLFNTFSINTVLNKNINWIIELKMINVHFYSNVCNWKNFGKTNNIYYLNSS